MRCTTHYDYRYLQVDCDELSAPWNSFIIYYNKPQEPSGGSMDLQIELKKYVALCFDRRIVSDDLLHESDRHYFRARE